MSICAIPANPAALLTAKALGISEATQRLVFKQTKAPSLGQQIRAARRRVAKAERMAANSPTAYQRAVWARVLARFQRDEAELRERAARPVSPLEELKIRADALSAEVAAIGREIARAQDPYDWDAVRREHDQAIANYTANAKAHLDPKPYTPSTDTHTTTWRGQKIDRRPVWRGRKV